MDEREDWFFPEDDEDEGLERRRSIKPFILLGILVLLVVLIGGCIFTFTRLTQGARVSGVTPTPSLPAGSNQFYFIQSPPWGTISVDGHVLKPLPTPDSRLAPLTLSIGIHQVDWHADPFPPEHCVLYIPVRFEGDSCEGDNSPQTFPGSNGHQITAYLISFLRSLTDLAPEHQNALMSAIQQRLNQLQGTDTVQPGERFVDNPQTPGSSVYAPPTIKLATEPVHAVLHFQYTPQSQAGTTNTPCDDLAGLIDDVANCTNEGQSCFSMCLFNSNSGQTSESHWTVLAPIAPFWDYYTAAGKVIVQFQSDPPQIQLFLMAFSIHWNGSNWQVDIYHDATIDRSVIGNPACEAARYEVGIEPRLLTFAGSNEQVVWKYVSGTNSAAGCVAEAYLQAANGTITAKPVAECLYRFGVLLAVDSPAQHSWPFLLAASPYEQSVTQQILAQAHTI